MLKGLKNRTVRTNTFPDRQRRIYDFLEQHPVGVLATVSPNGDPHGVAIYFSVDRQFKISFLTRVETRKYDNLKHSNHAMLTVFDAATQTTVQVTGITEEITDSYEVNRVAATTLGASLKTSDAGLAPIIKLQAGRYVAFTLKPVSIRMAVYTQPGTGDYNELFESIESFDLYD